MQAKVSMVMPCYNKVEYIGAMFDSIIAQDWDNIELILVNDGSTDGTRDVIAEYEPKFKNRGFEVVIIDQENTGVCAAAKNGLAKITGDYVCCVDSDDELDPKYVSTMAGWLEEHKDYDFAMCNSDVYEYKNGVRIEQNLNSAIPSGNPNTALSECVFHFFNTEVWRYLIRKSYFDRCKVVENYITDTKWSHEPSFVIPVLGYKGKYKYFNIPLYHFNLIDGSHSIGDKSYQHQLNYWKNYTDLFYHSIDLLDISQFEKDKFKEFTEFGYRYMLYILGLSDNDEDFRKCFEPVLYGKNIQPATEFAIKNNLQKDFIKFYKNYLIGNIDFKAKLKTYYKRIIGYGVLGKRGKKFLPVLKNTTFEPTELWDKNGDGITVKKPDFDSLTKDDLVIIFPIHLDLDCNSEKLYIDDIIIDLLKDCFKKCEVIK